MYSGLDSSPRKGSRLPLKDQLKQRAFAAVAFGSKALQGTPQSLSEIRRFLFLFHPAALGSAVHATPLFAALRAAVPHATITVCASGFGLEILRHNPAVDHLIESPDPNKDFFGAMMSIRRARPLQGSEPYATILSASNKRPALALAATLAAAENLVGFSVAPDLLRLPLLYDSELSQIANDLRIVVALGHPRPPHYEPQAFFSPEDLAYAQALTARFAEPGKPLLVFVTQTSPTQRKSWRSDRFTAAAAAMIQRHDANILLVGSRGEQPAVEALAQTIGGHARSVAGETNLLQLAALLSLCRAGLTLDTGILHMARAVGLPMVVIAPAWSPPHEWLPLGNPRYIILKNLDLPTAPPYYMIDEVSVDEAVAGLDRLLAME